MDNMHDRRHTRPYNGHDGSPERIEEDIRQTRCEMDETLDRLGEQLRPARIAGDLWRSVAGSAPDADAIASTAKDIGRGISQRIARHPIPSAILGVGLLWLLSEEVRGEHTTASDLGHGAAKMGAAGTAAARNAGSAVRSTGSAMGQAAHSASHAAGQAMSNVAHSARSAGHALGSAAERAWHAGEHALSGAAHATERAAHAVSERADRTIHATEEAYDQRPLAFGVAALAAGLAAGMLIPDTRGERRLFGKAARDLRHGAAAAGSRAGHNVAEAARETASDFAAAARDTAAQGIDRLAEVVDEEIDDAERHIRRGTSRPASNVESKPDPTAPSQR